jgi:hypothetical protein
MAATNYAGTKCRALIWQAFHLSSVNRTRDPKMTLETHLLHRVITNSALQNFVKLLSFAHTNRPKSGAKRRFKPFYTLYRSQEN